MLLGAIASFCKLSITIKEGISSAWSKLLLPREQVTHTVCFTHDISWAILMAVT